MRIRKINSSGLVTDIAFSRGETCFKIPYEIGFLYGNTSSLVFSVRDLPIPSAIDDMDKKRSELYADTALELWKLVLKEREEGIQGFPLEFTDLFFEIHKNKFAIFKIPNSKMFVSIASNFIIPFQKLSLLFDILLHTPRLPSVLEKSDSMDLAVSPLDTQVMVTVVDRFHGKLIGFVLPAFIPDHILTLFG